MTLTFCYISSMTAESFNCRLSREQEQAIAVLLAERTIAAAARRLKVHPSTLRHWLRQPAFDAAFREARAEILRSTVQVMELATADAVAALRRACKHKDPEVVLKAAGLLLSARNDAVAQLDIVNRLKELESRLPKGAAP
jgi:transposase-like protein